MKKQTVNQQPTSVFSGINEADPQGNYPKLKDGEHRIKILECLLVNGFYGTSYIIECEVQESTVMTAGTKASISIGGLTNPARAKTAQGTIKSFLAAVYNCDPNAADADGHSWQELADDSVSPDQPCVGQEISVLSTTTTTKAGFPFIRYTFDAVE